MGQGNVNGEWKELYRAALLEEDETELRERIEIAERAIRSFAGELEDHSADSAQVESLYDALRALDALRRLYCSGERVRRD
jgi:signal transduction histidine kinase